MSKSHTLALPFKENLHRDQTLAAAIFSSTTNNLFFQLDIGNEQDSEYLTRTVRPIEGAEKGITTNPQLIFGSWYALIPPFADLLNLGTVRYNHSNIVSIRRIPGRHISIR